MLINLNNKELGLNNKCSGNALKGLMMPKLRLFSCNGMYLKPFAVGPGPPDFVITFHVPML